MNLIELLSEGKENAITASELAQIMDCNSREVTLYIHALRSQGKVICSSREGYFLPSSLDEVQRFYQQMTSRQYEIEKAKQSAKEYIESHGGECVCM